MNGVLPCCNAAGIPTICFWPIAGAAGCPTCQRCTNPALPQIWNKSLSTGVSIEKTGPKEATSGQPVRYVFSRIGNTSNVMLQSFYWRDTLPAAVRLDKVVTGTYNFPGTYKIVYKVNNTGDYRTLADSLSTSRNYTLAASPTALGLAANERVTEIMFVFGQAPRRLQSGGGPHAPLQGRVRPDRREQLCECGRRGRNP